MATLNDVYPRLQLMARTSGKNADHLGGHLPVIDTGHRFVHLGVHFFHTATAIVGNAAFLYHVFLTPAHGTPETECHLLYAVTTSVTADIELWEGVTGTAPTVGPFNSRRDSANVADMLVASATTGYTGGTLLDKFLAGVVGNARVRTGGASGRDGELILKPSTLYAIKVSSLAADNRVSSQLSWYEIGRNIVGGIHVF